MARYGVIADIHGNREALTAAFAALEARGVSRIVCLGDIVGYNADPDECVAMVRKRCAVTIAGTHELIGLGRLDFGRCSNNAEYALRRTRRTLGREAAGWLASLPQHHLLDRDVVLVHGGVRDVQQYMKTPAQITQNAEWLRSDFPGARLCLYGHSHEQKVYEVHDSVITDLPLEDKILLNREKLYFINPGSVDASRKRANKFAECAILDTLDWSIEFLRLRYDNAATEAKAAVFGYRIGPWTNRLYSLKRRIARRTTA
jgi:predicted phosphodiesterase